jgi:O-antigen ligase
MLGYYLYLTFVISYFLHLPSRIPALGYIRFDLLLVASIFLCSLIKKGQNLKEIRCTSDTTKQLLFFIVSIVISLPFVKWPGSVLRFGLESYLKVIIFYFFTIWHIDSKKKFKIFIYLFILCQMIRIVEPIILHIAEGYWGSMAYIQNGRFLNRLSGAPHDVVNPNQFAWVIVTTLSFIYYLGWQKNNVIKLISIGFSMISIYALILTGSRSGLLSLGMLIVAILLLKRIKFKRLIFISFLLIPLFLFVLNTLSPDLKDRYRSIWDSSAPGRYGVEGRIEGTKKTFSLFIRRPIFGYGLGTSIETNYNVLGSAQITHNLYIEILQETGIVGFILFFMYVQAIIKSLIESKSIIAGLSEKRSFIFKIAIATQAWIVMHMFYSLSCFGLSSWEWYFFGGVSAVCLKLTKESEKKDGVKEKFDF